MSEWKHRVCCEHDPLEGTICLECDQEWPCDAERMRLQFEAAAEDRNQLAAKYETLRAEAPRALAEEEERVSEMTCVVCEQPITDSQMFRGMGDGSGQRFAHNVCYWRTRATELEIKYETLRAEARRALAGLRSGAATANEYLTPGAIAQDAPFASIEFAIGVLKCGLGDE